MISASSIRSLTSYSLSCTNMYSKIQENNVCADRHIWTQHAENDSCNKITVELGKKKIDTNSHYIITVSRLSMLTLTFWNIVWKPFGALILPINKLHTNNLSLSLAAGTHTSRFLSTLVVDVPSVFYQSIVALFSVLTCKVISIKNQ